MVDGEPTIDEVAVLLPEDKIQVCTALWLFNEKNCTFYANGWFSDIFWRRKDVGRILYVVVQCTHGTYVCTYSSRFFQINYSSMLLRPFFLCRVGMLLLLWFCFERLLPSFMQKYDFSTWTNAWQWKCSFFHYWSPLFICRNIEKSFLSLTETG